MGKMRKREGGKDGEKVEISWKGSGGGGGKRVKRGGKKIGGGARDPGEEGEKCRKR